MSVHSPVQVLVHGPVHARALDSSSPGSASVQYLGSYPVQGTGSSPVQVQDEPPSPFAQVIPCILYLID